MSKPGRDEASPILSTLGRIFRGLVVLLGGLVLLYGGALFSLDALRRSITPLALVFGLLLLPFSCHLFVRAWLLFANRPREEGLLLPPAALRVTAILMVALPVIAVVSTDWHLRQPMGWVTLLYALLYIAGAASLFRLASAREARQHDVPLPSPSEPADAQPPTIPFQAANQNEGGLRYLRISLGPGRCRGRSFRPGDPRRVLCAGISARIARLRALSCGQLRVLVGLQEERLTIEGSPGGYRTHRLELEDGRTLIAVQGFVSTWHWPTYYSFEGIGHLVAEGLVVEPDGGLTDAPDAVMFDLR